MAARAGFNRNTSSTASSGATASASGGHSGNLFVFGGNKYGQCGVEGAPAPADVRIPTKIVDGSQHDVLGVACGHSHTVLLLGTLLKPSYPLFEFSSPRFIFALHILFLFFKSRYFVFLALWEVLRRQCVDVLTSRAFLEACCRLDDYSPFVVGRRRLYRSLNVDPVACSGCIITLIQSLFDLQMQQRRAIRISNRQFSLLAGATTTKLDRARSRCDLYFMVEY